MYFKNICLSAIAFACISNALLMPCHLNESKPFILYAQEPQFLLQPLFLASDRADPGHRGNEYHGLTTTFPPNATTSIFEIQGGNLMAIKTGFPKMDPFQSTLPSNGSQVTFVPQFQHPPESSGFSLVKQVTGHMCHLAIHGSVTFYQCPNSYHNDSRPFVTYFTSGAPAECTSIKIQASRAHKNDY